jgi:hypothetical protein
MSQPSNPFLQETHISDFTPDIADFEQEMRDAAIMEEVKSGRLPADALKPEVLARLNRD